MSTEPIIEFGKFLYEKSPTLGFLFVVIVVVAFVTWKIALFWKTTRETNGKVPKIEETLGNIDKGLNTLNSILVEKEVIAKSYYSSSHSPRELNEAGQKLLAQSGAQEVYALIKPALLEELGKTDFDSKFDIERNALSLLLDKMDESQFSDLQDFAFNNPRFENNPLNYTDILYVMSLVLRDDFMAAHPEMDGALPEESPAQAASK